MTKKIALITGASKGIGKSLAEKFHSQGYLVAGCSRSFKQGSKNEYLDLTLACDVSQPSQVDAMLQEFKKHFHRCDVLVNNAGLANICSLSHKEDDSAWLDIIGVNLNGSYFVTKRFLPLMPEGGRIINVSSVLGLRAVPGSASYCASKFGVIGFTKSLALQLANRKITVNAVCPGWVDTDMAAERLEEMHVSKQAAAKDVPMGRFLDPKEIAETIHFLCSDAASMITGEALRIDGGSFV